MSSSSPENQTIEDEQNITDTKDGPLNQSPESKMSPDKRVTRSTTGNLKPKQQFDELQEQEELKFREKRKEEHFKRGVKKRERKNTKSNEHEGKDEKKSSSKKSNKDSEHESSSDDDDDDEIDYHEDDSDYSPEDDPDRPWCICRKPHGNKYEI